MLDADAIARLRAEFLTLVTGAATDRDLQAVRDRYLSRKGGVMAGLMKDVTAAAPADRPQLGRLANALKTEIEARIAERREALAANRPIAGAVDVTLPGRPPALGHRHPLTRVRDRMEAIFTRLGFAVVEGPEAEDEFHCFDALNMPASHPARDMQDTLYLAAGMRGEAWTPIGARPPDEQARDLRTLLRTHTSSMQVRYMQAHQPPIRIVVPGTVYRRDNPDLTHSPMFHQMEGLLVGEGVSLADLKGTLLTFAREMFAPSSRLRFRPSFFPYTEPSAEVDISCWACDGAGCQQCKRTGWLEILGCGMVHPAVFESVGYDPERYTGFAWGMGIERVAILRHGVDDIRLFFENDLRFLEQFPV
jgi:phenylalanyl-tRNA synthetase alpha chain